MQECGVDVDYTTLHRWVVKYAPLIARHAQKRKQPTTSSWRIDETYIKVKGCWVYQYRAIDKYGKILDFLSSEQRDADAATAFSGKRLKLTACRRQW